MKKDLHPEYNTITVKLADGSTFETRSTMKGEEYASEVDSTNHPFYTGKRQFVDTAGRVEKFNRRYGKTKTAQKKDAEDVDGAEEGAEDGAEEGMDGTPEDGEE